MYSSKTLHGCLTACVLPLVLAGTGQAQTLTPAENAFVAAMTAEVGGGQPDVEKNEVSMGAGSFTSIELEFDDVEISIVRFGDADGAMETIGSMAAMSGMADDPVLIELRGTHALMIEGKLADGDQATRLRAKAWKENPFSNPTSTIRLLMFNLQDGGNVVQVEAEGDVYRRLKRQLANQREAAADAIADPDDVDEDVEFLLVKSDEVHLEQDGKTSRLKVTDKGALNVIAPATPSEALRAFAKIVGYPEPEPEPAPTSQSANGASGVLDGLGR